MPSTNQPPYTLTSGVPLGGIGAGAVELGRDGRFRNITINNNRCADTRIPVSPASLLAVRVATEEGIYSRILQLEFTAQKEPTEPARLKSSEYEWRGLYPRSDFHLTDPHCPASLHWSAMAPIVPYDAQASSLPALLVRLRLANAQSYPLDIAVVFNWENLVGLTKARVPATLAPIVPEEVRPKAETWGVAAPPPEETPEGEAPAAPEKNGLLFGDLAAVRDNADGQYCLAVRPHAGTSSSVLTWDHDHLGDWRAFWSAFQMEGVIAGAALRGQAKKSGAVCSSFRLAPGEEFNVDFVLTWYCPRFKIAGRHLGNAYCNRYKNALEVAQEALKNIDYYSSSVDGWQKRLLLSSLPRWLSFGLMNSCHVFSTNTLYTREGQFALIDSPGDPRTARMDTRLQNSLATLLFFPRLEAAALQQATGLLLPGDEAVWIQHLGELCFHRPEAAPVTQATAICVNLVLSAYRNVMFTGSLARVQEVYPRLRKLIVAVLSQDTNGDALPNPLETQDSEGHSVPGLSSELAGLWVCSLRAMGELASQLRNASDVAWFQQAFDKAQASFERSFWNEEQGWYNHFVPAVSGADSALATACHVGQLAGQQYAGFLGLGDLFNPLHVQRALASMEQYLARPYGVVQWRGPEKGADEGAAPHAAGKREHECLLADAVVNFDSLQIHQGRPESGYGTLEKHFTHLRQGHDLRFDVPCVVNMVNAEETGALDRHASLLALWYVFFAIQGFRYHAPREQIVFTPRLPKNTHMLSVPLFTSFALGWLRFEERPNAPYALRVRFLFDSPIMVRSLVFRLPDFVRQVQVSCELSTGEMKVTHEVTRGRGETRLCIQTSRSVSITGVLYVDVWEAAHAGARSPRKARS